MNRPHRFAGAAVALWILLSPGASAQDREPRHHAPPPAQSAAERPAPKSVRETAAATVTAAAPVVDSADSMDLSSSVVKVFSVISPPDYWEPWRPGAREEVSGSGVILDGQRILTNAHNVANHVEIEVQREGVFDHFPARVELLNDTCDLALLKIDDPKFFAQTTPVPMGELPRLRQRVDVYGYPVGGENISTSRGVVSRIEVDFSAHSGEPVLMVQLDAAINHGNSGGPVVADGKLVGIATQRNEDAERIGSMIPTPVIRQFLDDSADGKIDGVPGPGFRYQPLQNPALRAFLKVPPGPEGILVKAVKFGGSAWGLLHEGDVVRKVDGVAVMAEGSVAFERGHVLFTHLFARHQVGDTVPVELLRAGAPLAVELKAAREPYLVPSLRSDVAPDYIVFGGAVLQPFTADYYSNLLSAKDQSDVPSELATYWNKGDPTPARRGVVLLSRLLPDEQTKSAGDLRDEVVASINGAAPADFEDAVRLIDSAKTDWLELLTSDGTRVAIDRAKALAGLSELLKRERIPADRSDRLRGK